MAKWMMACLVAMGMSSIAVSSELDNEDIITNVDRSSMEGTVVFRISEETGAVEMMATDKVLEATGDTSFAEVNSDAFKTVAADHIVSELDQDSGQSSWYYYNRGYGYSYRYYYHYGYRYSSYYSYYYRGYSYYYYGYRRSYRWY